MLETIGPLAESRPRLHRFRGPWSRRVTLRPPAARSSRPLLLAAAGGRHGGRQLATLQVAVMTELRRGHGPCSHLRPHVQGQGSRRRRRQSPVKRQRQQRELGRTAAPLQLRAPSPRAQHLAPGGARKPRDPLRRRRSRLRQRAIAGLRTPRARGVSRLWFALPGLRSTRVRRLPRAQAGGLFLPRKGVLSVVSGSQDGADDCQLAGPRGLPRTAASVRVELALRAAHPPRIRRRPARRGEPSVRRLGARLPFGTAGSWHRLPSCAPWSCHHHLPRAAMASAPTCPLRPRHGHHRCR